MAIEVKPSDIKLLRIFRDEVTDEAYQAYLEMPNSSRVVPEHDEDEEYILFITIPMSIYEDM